MPNLYDSQFYIKLNGSDLALAKMNYLHEVEVDCGFFMPATATLKFYDEKLDFIDDTSFALGTEVEVLAGGGANPGGENSTTSVFKGIITNIEPEFTEEGPYSMFVIRAYDKSFKMHRGTTSKAYVQVKDSDVVGQVARAAGLQADVDDTAVVHKHIFRHDQSDFEFVAALARRNGYIFYFDGAKLQFKKPASFTGNEVTCVFGKDLLEFRPRFAIGGQVNEVKVHGWDPKTKQAVVGLATNPVFAPSSTTLSRGPAAAQTGFSGAAKLHITSTPATQSVADNVAKSVMDRIAGSDMTAEGRALGNVKLKPGGRLVVANVGKFSGKYFITRVRHVLSQATSFNTEVWTGGMNTGTFASLLQDDPRSPNPPARPASGLLTAIVTNNTDDEKMGRVRIKFPTIADDQEAFWAPVVSVGAGATRGLMVIPEVNDEVLVGFVNGDFDRPYVLGGLWNGSDSLPNAAPVADGKVEIREWTSRVGHTVRLTDKSGEEKIEVIDKTGKNLLKIDTAKNTVSILAEQDIKLEAKGNIELKAANIKLEATAKVSVDGSQVQAEAKSQIALKGAMAELSASGITKISGSMVNIN